MGKPLVWTQESGARLRRLREARNLTQAALGHAVGTDGQQVSKWERGKGVSAAFLMRLAVEFGVSVDFLLAGQEKSAETTIERDPEEINPEIAKLRAMFPAGKEPTDAEISWVASHEMFHEATALGMAQAILGMRHGMSPEQARASAQETAKYRDTNVPARRPKGE